jgi:hypothetical protein
VIAGQTSCSADDPTTFARIFRAMIRLTLVTIVTGCGSAARLPTPRSSSPSLGWVHGTCVAVADPTLAAGTPVVLVIGDPYRLVQARVVATTTSCGRVPQPHGTDHHYTVAATDVPGDAGGFAVLGATPSVRGGQVHLGNQVLTTCTTSEGVRFAAWAGEPNRGEPIWSGYEYLGYDVTPTCP